MKAPNLFLERTDLWEDCCIGTLKDNEGNLLCHTLEPRWRDVTKGERMVKGQSAIPCRTYSLSMHYDEKLHFRCLKLSQVPGFSYVCLCFCRRDAAIPSETKGNILLGLEVDTEHGRLNKAIEAFHKVKIYYEMMRARRVELCLQVSLARSTTKHIANFARKHIPTSLFEDEDFYINSY